MMRINFFTPIVYLSTNASGSSMLEKIDNYFYLGGRKAYVIQKNEKTNQEKVILLDAKISFLAKIVKFFSYFTVILPLMMLMAKACLRSRHSFKLIDPKQKLEKGMNLPSDTAAKIEQLIPKIIKLKDDPAIQWLSKANNLVFQLKDSPNIVYKMAVPNASVRRQGKNLNSNERIEDRFAKMIKAKEVCLTHRLAHLIIPKAQKFDVKVDGKTYVLIAEEKLDFDSHESKQEELYQKYSKDLDETTRQLAIFVAKTGFNDVTWRNIPLLNDLNSKAVRRVALIDLESMEGAINGFLGDTNGSRGLIRCLSEEQLDLVITEAKKQGINITESQEKETKETRLKELEDDKKLSAFYAKKGILTGNELLQVNLDSLGLDLKKEGQVSVVVGGKWENQTITLKKVTEDIIKEINSLLQISSDQASIKGKRSIALDTHKNPLKSYRCLGGGPVKTFYNDEELKTLWIGHILDALVNKGHLFKRGEWEGSYYRIQA